LSGHKSGVRCVVFSNDADFLVSGSMDNTVKIWPAMDDIDFEYHNTFIKNIKNTPFKEIKEFPLPQFIAKYKNSSGSYNYPRIRYNLTPLHVLCYDKDLDNLKNYFKFLSKIAFTSLHF